MSLIDDLLDRWEELRERGQSISPEQLCADHSELLPEIRRQINALEAVSLQFGSVGSESEETSETSSWSPASQFEMLGRFEIIKLHASGGLGHVYLAHDKVLDRPVAIKFLKRAELTEEQLARFEWEARITGRLEHPGIVPIHSMQESESSTPCYVMRFVNGQTLQQRVESIRNETGGDFTANYFSSEQLRELLRSFATVCNIVAYAHSQGVIHRDIKPGNIMLGPFGETLLLDWGIAKQTSKDSRGESHSLPTALHTVPTDLTQLKKIVNIDSPTYTATGQAIGTPAYASPEQLRGVEIASQPTTDIFSLGATLHFILSGKSPIEYFGWSNYLDQFKVVDSLLATNLSARVPQALHAICNQAMRVQPQNRYATAMDLAEDIQNYLAHESVSVLKDPWHVRVARRARKRPAVAGATITGLLVVLVASLITSAMINAKNQKLALTTESLNDSLTATQAANDQAMAALRTLFDDVVLTNLAMKQGITKQERDYLNNALEQYNQFASIVGDQRKNLLIRAEANLKIAKMLTSLSQFPEAITKARIATQLYQDLMSSQASSESTLNYLEAISQLSHLESKYGDLELGLSLARDGIQLARQETPRVNEEQQLEFLNHIFSLQTDMTTGFIQKRDWNNAYVNCQEAIETAEKLFLDQNDDKTSKRNLAHSLSRLAELAVHVETNSDPRKRLEIANRSIRMYQELYDAEPELSNNHDELARSLYARALCYNSNQQPTLALPDVLEAIRLGDGVRIRYPAVDSFRSSVVEYRTLAAQLHHQLGDWRGVISQIEAARDLRLSAEAMSAYIALLSEYSKLFPERWFATDWLAELHRRRGSLNSTESDSPAAAADFDRSLRLYESLIEERPEEHYLHKSYVRALVARHEFKFRDTNQQNAEQLNAVITERAEDADHIRSVWERARQEFELTSEDIDKLLETLDTDLSGQL